jgi:hypothetical protein
MFIEIFFHILAVILVVGLLFQAFMYFLRIVYFLLETLYLIVNHYIFGKNNN